MNERELAEGSALLDLIGESEERLLALRGWTRTTHGAWLDASGCGVPYTRGRALAIVRREITSAVAALAGRAA